LPKRWKRRPRDASGGVRRALIIEDEQEFQFLLSSAIDHIGGSWRVHTFGLGKDALSFANVVDGKFDVALVDLGLPDICGTDAIRELRRRYQYMPILVVSVVTSSERMLAAFRAGASGYILKDDEIFDISSSINEVLKGNSPISTSMARALIDLLPLAPAAPQMSDFKLSSRETELLGHIVRGLSYPQAAEFMNLKVATLHAYSRTLFRKLGVKSQRQAVTMALKHGFVQSIDS